MYEVLYEPLETFGGAIETLSRNVSVTDMSVVLMDLEEFVYYNISVRAYTSVGEGPYSDGITELTDNDGNETFLHEAIAKYRRNWLLSACAYNTRQQENMRLTKSMRLIKSAKTR